MTDIERRLRDLGERVREEQDPSALPANTIRAAKRRRLGTALMSLVVVAALAFGGTFAAGAFDTTPSTLPPAGPTRTSETVRLQAAFPGQGRASAFVDPGEGVVCFGMADLRTENGLYTSIQILLGQNETRPVVLTPPPGNQAERPCVGNLDASLLESIISDPGRYYLEIKVPTNEFTGEETLIASLAIPATDDCTPVDFKPTYLPEGWVRELQSGSGGGEEYPGLVGHYGGVRDARAGYYDLVSEFPPFAQSNKREIRVLGSRARSGDIHEGFSVEFEYDGCSYILIAYVFDRVELERFAEGLRLQERGEEPVPTQDFEAIWPEDSQDQAREACRSAAQDDIGGGTVSIRQDPESVALEFGALVLGWEEPGVAEVDDPSPYYDHEWDGVVLELRRDPFDGDHGPRGPAVRVLTFEVQPDCWSIFTVQRMPDEQPKHHGSMAVRGRDVYMGLGTGGASSAVFEVGYGGEKTTHVWQAGDDEPVEFRLDFEPQDTGHYLVLLRNANGEVFSAFGSPLPEGDFAAG